ncbi:MAG: GTPase domain-containing protein [Thermodesulfovibrionales bacterium]|nr:GTPase domain-containing protein [Thermodesulfovibrionales bacterium]
MALFNYATKEIILKIVYYGPGLSGKTTNLEVLHKSFSPESVGKLISLSTEADRTLFFDFLPIELGRIKDFTLRFQLYTVPGQVRYNSTRKLVLKGADAVVFVADSQRQMREQNIESFQNMRENLIENNIDPDDIPVVLQYNKRDLPDILSVQELNNDLNLRWYPYIEAVAINGTGVKETFQAVTELLIKHLSKKYSIKMKEAGIIEVTPPVQAKEGPALTEEKRAPAIDSHSIIEDIYTELKRLSERIEKIEKIVIEKNQKALTSESIESQLIQIQKNLSELYKSHRDMIIQLRTVYDILSKARLEKKGIFF